MDVELVTEADENFTVNENNADYTNFEGERCGICMDVVIDRGVLDCCQHWFCFTCIDNWATITNLCPLCQSEFQLITCVPVYDTIGSSKTDEDLYSRDDDWCIEGLNNTLSFPSYYIDENAVVCLDGNGCKIRSRSATFEVDSVLDTSIACDACDVWYHAFCVGFDPEGTCENSWLCPRCVEGQMAQNADDVPPSSLGIQHGPENGGNGCLAEASFSGKVSVSVADAGETAIVVSLVEGNQGSTEPGGGLPILDLITNTKVDALLPSSVPDVPQPGELSSKRISNKQNSDLEELELSLSQNTCFSLSLPSTLPAADRQTEEPRLGSGLGISLTKSSSEFLDDKLLKSGLDLHLGLTMNSSAPVDSIDNTPVGDQVPGIVNEKSHLQAPLPDVEVIPDKEQILSCGSMIPDKHIDIAPVTGAKRKLKDARSPDTQLGKAEIDVKVSPKKVKVEALDGSGQLVSSKDYSSTSDDDKLTALTTGNTESKCESEKKGASSDIMNIVQGTGRKRWKQSARINSTNVSSRERENATRLRVKKIMRRTGDDADSSLLVEKLRKEIREAVRNKSSKEIGESIFDPKLLAAFRAVVAGPITDSKKPPLDLKAKKALLQKGKVRENLTKKIYGVGGRRKRAWTRDCEVEFWKHRCSKISRPEKVQTLKSVLDLLRNDASNKEMKHGKEGEASSILSRLYLADTSIFPRKNDIRPVSAIKDDSIPEKNKGHNSPKKLEKNPPKDEVSKKMVVTPALESKRPKQDVSGLQNEAASTKCQTKNAERPFTSQIGGSRLSPQQELPGVSDNIKSDKRKWALELLARKTATDGPKEEDSVMLKGNYPLLAQLPKDMRPTLAPTRHNKIPTSIRQAQLYHLAEHLLRKTNQPVIRVTAETELAVADAVNIEKEVANRSNSKAVYMNLCSQELSRRSDDMNLGRAETTPPMSAGHSDGPEENNDTSSDLEVNEALKLAGLSDTPPSSPTQLVEDTGLLKKNEDDGPDDVFQMHSQPELDIYGDFEYNLEDDDFIGANVVKTSELLPEGSRMKVLFSTLNLDKSNGSSDLSGHEGSACIKPILMSSGHERPTQTRNSIIDSGANDNHPQTTIADEDTRELSLAECEELYGPDKEPLVLKYPGTAPIKPHDLPDGKDTGIGNGCDGFCKTAKPSEPERDSCTGSSEVSKVHQGVSGSANSPSHPQNAEQMQRKEKSSTANSDKQLDSHNLVSKKVEAYIKEHIRPLCKSGVITVEQYRWAVGKTTEKVMKFHSKDKNANFLIKEGEKVKTLAERYVESAQQTAKTQ